MGKWFRDTWRPGMPLAVPGFSAFLVMVAKALNTIRVYGFTKQWDGEHMTFVPDGTGVTSTSGSSSFGVTATTPETEDDGATVTIAKGYTNYMGGANTLIAEATIEDVAGTSADPHYITLRTNKSDGTSAITELAANPDADDGTYWNRVLWEVFLTDAGEVRLFDRRPDWNYGIPIDGP